VRIGRVMYWLDVPAQPGPVVLMFDRIHNKGARDNPIPEHNLWRPIYWAFIDAQEAIWPAWGSRKAKKMAALAGRATA